MTVTVYKLVPRTDAERAADEWSVSSLIVDALATAEARFGPRDQSYELEGFAFFGPVPTLSSSPHHKRLLLKIAANAKDNPEQALYQLSHEVVHVLAPAGTSRPSVIEEGLATLFSEQYTACILADKTFAPTIESYRKARDAVAKFLSDDSLMRAIRSEEPTFSEMTPALLKKHNPNCSDEDAQFLCSSFNR